MNASTLPDNLISRFSRIYTENRSFEDSSGKTVKYDRLIHEFTVKGETVQIEFKPEKKDLLLLSLADTSEQRDKPF